MRFSTSLAIVGIAACATIYAVNYQQAPSTSATYTPITPDERAFMNYIVKFGKSYATKEEYNYRFEQFRLSLAKIAVNNGRNDVTFVLGLNQFSDMPQEEYKKLLGYKKVRRNSENIKLIENSTIGPSDTSVDWRQNGVVSPVRDQGMCGSCWAFSAVSTIESSYAILTGKLLDLSEQQLVDCSAAQGNEGCNGGWMDQAFTYAETEALEGESTYPYIAVDSSCQFDPSQGLVKVTSFVDVAPNNPQQLKNAVNLGPVSVAIQADQYVFQAYQSGILNDPACGTELDHAVVIVGFGEEQGQQYWIVRNSWGPAWGDNGYIRIANAGISDAGICGINSQPSYPVTAQA
jgi:C1A family cysteine protease